MNPSPSSAVDPQARKTWLDVLANALAKKSVTTHITHDERLFVQHGTAKQHVTAAPDDRSGDWFYWFGTECIAPVGDLRRAAAAVMRRLAEQAVIMPGPPDITCPRGKTFTADKTSNAAKDKLRGDCAAPEARGL